MNEVIIKILCHILEDDDAIIMLLREQLAFNPEVTAKIFNTDEEFIDAFHDKVHLCIIDFRPTKMTARNGNDITGIILDKYADSKVIMITGIDDKDNNCQNIIEFYDLGGFRWLYKDDVEFVSKFTKAVQAAIHKIKDNLYRKKVSQEIAGTVVRDREYTLSNKKDENY